MSGKMREGAHPKDVCRSDRCIIVSCFKVTLRDNWHNALLSVAGLGNPQIRALPQTDYRAGRQQDSMKMGIAGMESYLKRTIQKRTFAMKQYSKYTMKHRQRVVTPCCLKC
jgi:hypothetical protein